MIVLLTSAFLGLGIVVGRWWLLAVPLVLWPGWYAARHFLGPGLGEAWWLGLVVVTGSSVALAALGVFLRRTGFGHRGYRTASRGRSSAP